LIIIFSKKLKIIIINIVFQKDHGDKVASKTA